MSLRRKLTALTVSAVLVVPAAVLSVVVAAAPATAATYTGYAMAYFTESPSGTANNYGLHLAVSPDGLDWEPLNQNAPVLTPTLGTKGLRDPYIFRKQDGTFVVVATDLTGTNFTQNNQYLHVWTSPDLRTFSSDRLVKMHSYATHTWAPEVFWDPTRQQYGIIYSAAVDGRDKFLVNYTTDFVSMSEPQVFFDPGFNVLDGDILVSNGVGYLYYKNISDGLLYGARSTTLQPGSFTTYTAGRKQGNGIEAPELVKSNTSNTFWLYGDSYSPANGRLYGWQTSDISTDSWSVLNDRAYTQPLNAKHVGITPITATEMSNLITTWGAPSWNRLKSYNYPGRYVRHSNFVARIDAYPFDPFQDQEWKIVPGLADSSAVSFESVGFPGYYLRHSNYQVSLVQSDGSASFKADATFTKVAGLADSSWSSFRSYNFPTYYLRHYNSVLRIDPISGSTAQQDATWKVTF